MIDTGNTVPMYLKNDFTNCKCNECSAFTLRDNFSLHDLITMSLYTKQ